MLNLPIASFEGQCEEKVTQLIGQQYPCYDEYTYFNEEQRDFNHHWNGTTVWADEDDQSPNIMWKYRHASDTNSMWIQGELGTYFGGGYSVDFFPKQDNHEILEHLLDDHWLNRGTRAVIVSYTVYNSAVNCLSSVTLLMEFPISAGVVRRHSILTFQAIKYVSEDGVQLIIVEVVTVLLVLYYLVVMLQRMWRQRCFYFASFWNLIDFALVACSIASIVMHVYRTVMESHILSKVAEKKPNESIGFGEVGFWGYGYVQAVACVNFFATIRLVKLLRFNRRTSLLEATLMKAKRFLYSYAICFVIVMSGFVIFASMLFRTRIYDYRQMGSAVSSVIRLLLGKYKFADYQNAHHLLGPVFFMAFNMMTNWVMINMMISILDDASAVVKKEKEMIRSKDAEAMTLLFQYFKSILFFLFSICLISGILIFKHSQFSYLLKSSRWGGRGVGLRGNFLRRQKYIRQSFC